MTSKERMEWLDGLKAGVEVKVVIPGQWNRVDRYELATVTKVTRTRVFVDGKVFNRVYTRTPERPGRGYGKTEGRIEPVTPGFRRELVERDLRDRFEGICRKAAESIPLHVVKAMVKAYDAAIASGDLEKGEK